MTVIRRQPFVGITIDGRDIGYNNNGAMSARVSYGYDSQIAEADFEVAVVPSWARPWSQVVIRMGAAPGGFSPIRFVGYFVEPEYTLYSRSVRMTCRGRLIKAQLAENHVVGGTDLACQSGAGERVPITDSAMVSYVLDHCGLAGGYNVNAPAGGTGQLLGQISDGFTWGEGESALAFIQRLEQVTYGYRTFDSPSGMILRRFITTHPSGNPTFTFEEGVDIYHASNVESISNIKNSIMVTGYDNRSGVGGIKAELFAPIEQFSPLLPSGVDYISHSFSSSMIERSYMTDPLILGEYDNGYGVSCEAVALGFLSEMNRQVVSVTLTTPRDDMIYPGMTIMVNSSDRLGFAGLLWVQHVECSIDNKGQFTQVLKCLGGAASTAPILIPRAPNEPPTVAIVADFAFGVTEMESVVIGGVQVEVYTISCEATVLLTAGTVSTYAWSATPGAGTATPETGTGPQYTVVFTDLSIDATVSLIVVDSLGRISTTMTKTVPTPLTTPYVQRKIYTAAAPNAEAFDGSTWREAVVRTWLVANGPLWALYGDVLTSADDLATFPSSSTPFGGTDVSALYVESYINPLMVLAGARDGRVAVSYDGASTWAVVTGPDSYPVTRCVISLATPAQWWVLTDLALYQTLDSGASWATVQAAVGDELFDDVCVGPARIMIAMYGGRLVIDGDGTPQTFITGAPSEILAITEDIGADRFYCYDSSGNTYYTTNDAGTTFTQRAALPSSATPQMGGLWRDWTIRGLLYFAAGPDGAYKSLDGFATPGGYLKIRQRSVDGASAESTWNKIGVGSLFTQVPVVGGMIPSDTVAKMLSLWNVGTSSNDPIPADWMTPAFDDSAWSSAVVATTVGDVVPFAGTDPIWSEEVLTHTGEIVLFRRHFSFGGGGLSAVSLQLETAISGSAASWLNNTYLGSSVDPDILDMAVSTTALVTGDNVLATQMISDGYVTVPSDPLLDGGTISVIDSTFSVTVGSGGYWFTTPVDIADGDVIYISPVGDSAYFPSSTWPLSNRLGGQFFGCRVWHTGDPTSYLIRDYYDVGHPGIAFSTLVLRGCDPTAPASLDYDADGPITFHSSGNSTSTRLAALCSGVYSPGPTRHNSLLFWQVTEVSSRYSMTPPDGYTVIGEADNGPDGWGDLNRVISAYKIQSEIGSTGDQVGTCGVPILYNSMLMVFQPPAPTPVPSMVSVVDSPTDVGWIDWDFIPPSPDPATVTVAIQEAVADGDVILVMASNDYATPGLYDGFLDDGWSLGGNMLSGSLKFYMMIYRVWHTGDPMSFNLSCHPNPPNYNVVRWLLLRGCDPTAPMVSYSDSEGGEGSQNITRTTTTRNNSLVIWVATMASPSVMSDIYWGSVSRMSDPPNFCALLGDMWMEGGALSTRISWGIMPVAGDTGDIKCTPTPAPYWGVQLIAFQPPELPTDPAWTSYALDYS